MLSLVAPVDIYNQVEPYAKEYNVPDTIWETIVQNRSGFNPQLVNPNGNVYGLFGLDINSQGAQAINDGMVPSNLTDPRVNAQYGMPALGQAWSDLGANFNDSYSWWVQFAVESGQPSGRSPADPSVLSEAAKDKSTFDRSYNQGQWYTGSSSLAPFLPQKSNLPIYILLGVGAGVVGYVYYKQRKR